MAVSDLGVLDYGRVPDGHVWTVANTTLKEPGTPSRRLPSWDVWFRRSYEKATGFFCECREYGPGARSTCDHIFAAVLHITRVKGPWEQDRFLMEKAWELVSDRKRKREKPNFTVRRDDTNNFGDESFLVYEPGIGGVRVDKKIGNLGVAYRCPCPENRGDSYPCDHVKAVMEFEKDGTDGYSLLWDSTRMIMGSPLTKGPPKDNDVFNFIWGEGPSAKGTDPSTYSTRTYSDREGSIRPEDLEKIKKVMEPKNKKTIITVTDQATGSFQKMIEAMNELNGSVKAIADPEEPEEPEEPKKPRSRFSEIDL